MPTPNNRDIKYENIMFESCHPNIEVKIIDYGLSKRFHPDNPKMSDSVGTIFSMALGRGLHFNGRLVVSRRRYVHATVT